MCGSMVDIQCATSAIRRGKKKEETTGQNIGLMACPITQGGQNKSRGFVHAYTCTKRFSECFRRYNSHQIQLLRPKAYIEGHRHMIDCHPAFYGRPM